MQKVHNNPLTRKVGPLPVYAYALAALAAWFLFLRSPQAAGGSGLPYTPSGSGSAAQQPASGQGSAADNANSDLLDSLNANSNSIDALLAALQTGGQGVTGAGTSGGSSGTAATSAATVGADTNNAPTDSFSTNTNTTSSSPPAVYDPANPTYILPDPSGGAPTYFTPGTYFQNEQGLQTYQPPGYGGLSLGARDDAYALANASQTFNYALAAAPSQPVSAPTPYATVTPAPVDTSSVVVAPSPGIVGKNIAS